MGEFSLSMSNVLLKYLKSDENIVTQNYSF